MNKTLWPCWNLSVYRSTSQTWNTQTKPHKKNKSLNQTGSIRKKQCMPWNPQIPQTENSPVWRRGPKMLPSGVSPINNFRKHLFAAIAARGGLVIVQKQLLLPPTGNACCIFFIFHFILSGSMGRESSWKITFGVMWLCFEWVMELHLMSITVLFKDHLICSVQCSAKSKIWDELICNCGTYSSKIINFSRGLPDYGWSLNVIKALQYWTRGQNIGWLCSV